MGKKPGRLQALDLRLFRRITRQHSAGLDSVLLPLTRLADRSVLWILIGFGLAAGGGRFGKRAALRGLVAVATTSLLANQPMKRMARRRRPALLPKARRLVRQPTSFSFPSGHAASAAAFSTAVSMELPEMALPLGSLALGVAYSRVYSGVHYPIDVAAGAGMGMAIALATRRYWPLAAREPAEARPVYDRAAAPSLPEGEGLTLVVNPSAGSGASESELKYFRDALPGAQIVQVRDGKNLRTALEQAARESLALGIAGGDGSVNAAAAAALEAGKPLAVIPAGTLNHLARDLGIASAEDSFRAVREGTAVAVDVGLIAGKPFLNTASFGSYADLVDIREKLEPKIGKWPAMFFALGKVLGRTDPVEVSMDGRKRKIWMIFVGNCCYQPSGFAPTSRERLDDGNLDLRLVDASPPWGKARLMVAVLTGTLARTKVYEEWITKRVEVESLAGDLRLARDGEVFDSPRRFLLEKAAASLPIYRPESEES